MKNFNSLTTAQKDIISTRSSIDYNLACFHHILEFVSHKNPSILSSISNDFDNFINSLTNYVEENINSRTETATSED